MFLLHGLQYESCCRRLWSAVAYIPHSLWAGTSVQHCLNVHPLFLNIIIYCSYISTHWSHPSKQEYRYADYLVINYLAFLVSRLFPAIRVHLVAHQSLATLAHLVGLGHLQDQVYHGHLAALVVLDRPSFQEVLQTKGRTHNSTKMPDFPTALNSILLHDLQTFSILTYLLTYSLSYES